MTLSGEVERLTQERDRLRQALRSRAIQHVSKTRSACLLCGMSWTDHHERHVEYCPLSQERA